MVYFEHVAKFDRFSLITRHLKTIKDFMYLSMAHLEKNQMFLGHPLKDYIQLNKNHLI
jgi:hypothetical protein